MSPATLVVTRSSDRLEFINFRFGRREDKKANGRRFKEKMTTTSMEAVREVTRMTEGGRESSSK